MSVPSVTIAKDRLRNLLITDRIQCTTRYDRISDIGFISDDF